MCSAGHMIIEVVYMKHGGNTDPYNRLYTELNFDRAGLFEAIMDRYCPGTVLYPGCSIHITPSFYFRHVIYVDISETAKEFFQDERNVLSIIDSNKKYKQSPYIRFISSDYTSELPVRENEYDLLLSIYAGGISEACKKYVRRGGIIVSNNHQNDARQALKDPSLRLEAIIRRKGKKYSIDDGAGEDLQKALSDHGIPAKSMKNPGSGFAYVDNECYFVFRRMDSQEKIKIPVDKKTWHE
jgi:hypothetical protein